MNTGNPGSVIVLQYGSIKITVFVRAENTILKFLGNTVVLSQNLGYCGMRLMNIQKDIWSHCACTPHVLRVI